MSNKFVKIGDTEFEVYSVSGKVSDTNWDNRETKTLNFVNSYDKIKDVIQNSLAWSIVSYDTKFNLKLDESGNVLYDTDGVTPLYDKESVRTEYDNPDFSIVGDIIIHNNGTVSVTMGKPTSLENAYKLLYGGIE